MRLPLFRFYSVSFTGLRQACWLAFLRRSSCEPFFSFNMATTLRSRGLTTGPAPLGGDFGFLAIAASYTGYHTGYLVGREGFFLRRGGTGGCLAFLFGCFLAASRCCCIISLCRRAQARGYDLRRSALFCLAKATPSAKIENGEESERFSREKGEKRANG